MERNTNNILDIHTHKAEPVSAGKAIINRKLATDALCEGYFYSAGIHPWDLTEFDTERRLECLREQLAEKQLVAVGEAGLCEGYGRTACLEKGTCTETAVDMAWIPWKA